MNLQWVGPLLDYNCGGEGNGLTVGWSSVRIQLVGAEMDLW